MRTLNGEVTSVRFKTNIDKMLLVTWMGRETDSKFSDLSIEERVVNSYLAYTLRMH